MRIAARPTTSFSGRTSRCHALVATPGAVRRLGVAPHRTALPNTPRTETLRC